MVQLKQLPQAWGLLRQWIWKGHSKKLFQQRQNSIKLFAGYQGLLQKLKRLFKKQKHWKRTYQLSFGQSPDFELKRCWNQDFWDERDLRKIRKRKITINSKTFGRSGINKGFSQKEKKKNKKEIQTIRTLINSRGKITLKSTIKTETRKAKTNSKTSKAQTKKIPVRRTKLWCSIGVKSIIWIQWLN